MIEIKEVPIAISADALLGKSRVYIYRALECKASSDLDQYQFWASLSLELLGKAALSKIHPSLIVDPNHYFSILAASGIVLSTKTRTIQAHTLFKRLGYLSPNFDEKVKKFCDDISQRRNRELHSGEAPFRRMEPGSWQSEYWHSAHVILEILGISFEEWLGADDAKLPKSVVEGRESVLRILVTRLLDTAKNQYESLSDSQREAKARDAEYTAKIFFDEILGFEPDAEWEVSCPACQNIGFMAGMQYEEEYTDADEHGPWTVVERGFEGELFYCPICGLKLQGFEELQMSRLPTNRSEIERDEAEYFPEYGNE